MLDATTYKRLVQEAPEAVMVQGRRIKVLT